jgi:hypothetical protein
VDKKFIHHIFVIVALVIYLLAPGPVFGNVERVYGRAFNKDGMLEYSEEHIIQYENGRIAAINTTYYSVNSQRIGSQLSDFSKGPLLVSYDFKDERLQYNDGVQVMSDRILIYCKETPDAKTKKKYLSRESNQIIGQGFNQFIVSRLDALARGDLISAKLLLPAQMDQFNVRISKHKIEENRILVRIELDNWFLRLFTPHVEAEYDLNTGRLLKYQGVSMISDEDGKTVEVTTVYDYPRQPALLGWTR